MTLYNTHMPNHMQQQSESICMLKKKKNPQISTWSSAPEIMFIFKLKWKFSRAPEQRGGRTELCYWRVYRGQQLPKQSCCSNHRGIFHSAEKNEWQLMMDGVWKSTELGEEFGAEREYHMHLHHAPAPSPFVMEMAPQVSCLLLSVYMPVRFSSTLPCTHSQNLCSRAAVFERD